MGKTTGGSKGLSLIHILVREGVAAVPVDRREHFRRIVFVEEGAGAVVDGFAGHRHIVGVHHAVNEAELHPSGDQFGLRGDDLLIERNIRVLRLGSLGIVPGNDMVGEHLQAVDVTARSKELERADADVAGCDARDDRARQPCLTVDNVCLLYTSRCV